MKKVAVFFAAGFEEVEAVTVVDLLRREEIETLIVSVTDELFVASARGILMKADISIKDIDFDTIDMIVLPGGLDGRNNLEACELLMEQIDRFHQQGKPLAAICAAPAILAKRGILNGIKACVYPTFESSLNGATILQEAAVWDGHIITGRGMGCSIDFALAIVAYFKGFAAADSLAEKIVYQ
ncbi:MAG: DJ-1/PfpI family protein [Lachnospiraceae bacterium]|nr:DJ-1/PfpI family protein [Lachnospiraceae bacterium]